MQINRTFLAVCRTIHIYLTLLGLGVLLFFGLTGFTVNHEDWFGATRPRVTKTDGSTPVELLGRNDSLRIVEHLRQTFHITGALADFADLDTGLAASFKDPGQNWEVTIDKATGKTTVVNEAFNFAAVINNLHRGRYAGPVWRWVIDLSALLIVLACATGVVLWLVMPQRRKIGVAALVLGVCGTLAIYLYFVPGPDAAAPAAPATVR